jgi:hypothetical protein
MEGLMGRNSVPEPYDDVREFRRETPVRPNQARVDRVNVFAMCYVTRQPEPFRIEGQGKCGAGRHVQ